jgi:hypothetical protein
MGFLQLAKQEGIPTDLAHQMVAFINNREVPSPALIAILEGPRTPFLEAQFPPGALENWKSWCATRIKVTYKDGSTFEGEPLNVALVSGFTGSYRGGEVSREYFMD